MGITEHCPGVQLVFPCGISWAPCPGPSSCSLAACLFTIKPGGKIELRLQELSGSITAAAKIYFKFFFFFGPAWMIKSKIGQI